MSGNLDIQKVIEKSTSQVSLEDLNRKGVKRVKVLNQAAIQRLINEAVDRVLSERAEEIGARDREQIIEQSRAKFQKLAKEELGRERTRAADLEDKLRDLEQRAQVSVEERKAFSDAATQIRGLTDERQEMRDQILALQKREVDMESLSEKLAQKAKELVAKEESFREREEELRGKDEEMAGKSQELASRTEQLALKTDDLTDKVDELTKRSQEFAEREAQLRKRAEELDRQETAEQSAEELRKRAEEIATREAALSAQQQSFEQSRAEIESKTRELEIHQQKLTELGRELESAQAELESGGAASEEVDRLKEELAERDKFLSRLEGEINAKNDEIVRLASGNGGGDVSGIQQTLEGLQKSIATMGRGGGGGPGVAMNEVDAETMLKFADTGDDTAMESNFKQVEVKNKKSAGVKSSLAKLKQLNKGV